MNSKNLLGFQDLKLFDFSDTYIGYVLDNSDFVITNKIKVFIPQIFGYTYTKGMEAKEFKDSIRHSNLLNKDELVITTEINSMNYLYCKAMINNYHLKNIGNYTDLYKPDNGSTVLVNFLNNNPNTPFYINYSI